MSLLTREDFLSLSTIKELEAKYREQGFEGESEQLLLQAQTDWYEIALEAAKEVTEDPESFEPEVRERDGIRYQVYGVIHGILGGDDKDYMSFVSTPIAKPSYVIFENGLNYFYAHKDGTTIPDFVVLGILGSLGLGFRVGLGFPILIWEMVSEMFKRDKKRGAEEGFIFNPRYHSLDGEIRRGVEPDPPLPSRLQIDYEMERWDRLGAWGRFWDPYSIVPRSMFMAGFAVGHSKHAKIQESKTVTLVVGDLHTMELCRFLEDEQANHPVFLLGKRYGEKVGIARFFALWTAKVLHLGLAGLAGTMILGPVLLLIANYVL